MSLLVLEHVSKRHLEGRSERALLDDVSLTVDRGELIAIWGRRRSGRSTLLRIAAGIELPDSGSVRFGDRDLTALGEDALGHGISYCRSLQRDREGRAVLDELMVGPLGRGVPHGVARARARGALERVDALDCAGYDLTDLDGAETQRVTLARALCLEPSLLLVDDAVGGVDVLERDKILTLLRSLANDGIAVLTTVSEATGLAGADRALSLGSGTLSGNAEPQIAPVTDLDARRQARG